MAADDVTIARATWRDVMAVWRLERACFPKDAYDPLTLLLLIIWPGNVTLKATRGETLVAFTL